MKCTLPLRAKMCTPKSGTSSKRFEHKSAKNVFNMSCGKSDPGRSGRSPFYILVRFPTTSLQIIMQMSLQANSADSYKFTNKHRISLTSQNQPKCHLTQHLIEQCFTKFAVFIRCIALISCSLK